MRTIIQINNGDVSIVAVGSVIVCLSGVFVVIGVLVGMVSPFKLMLELIKCPIWKLTSL